MLLGGIISCIVGLTTKNLTAYTACLTGYSLVALSLIMLVATSFQKIAIAASDQVSSFQTVKKLMSIGGPHILTVGALLVILTSIGKNKQMITNGHVAPTFVTYNTVALVLVALQAIILLVTERNKEMFSDKLITSFMYLISVFIIGCSGSIYIITNYYGTDGFSTIQ